MNSSEKILDELARLGCDHKPRIDLESMIIQNTDPEEPSDQEESLDQTEEELIIEENRTVCRLFNLHMSDFYDNIYVPFRFFKKGGWDIVKVLNNNEDSIFFNKLYLPGKDLDRFYDVFDKYITMIEDIMSPDSLLISYLKNWTDMSGIKWKENKNKSYIKLILSKTKYSIISPLYIINLFHQLKKTYENNTPKIKSTLEEKLDEVVKEARTIKKEFKKIYSEIIDMYVYEYPLDEASSENYVKSFINTILTTIFDYAEKLIDINIYAIHPIFIGISNDFLPLDEINSFDPSENSNKNLYIV